MRTDSGRMKAKSALGSLFQACMQFEHGTTQLVVECEENRTGLTHTTEPVTITHTGDRGTVVQGTGRLQSAHSTGWGNGQVGSERRTHFAALAVFQRSSNFATEAICECRFLFDCRIALAKLFSVAELLMQSFRIVGLHGECEFGSFNSAPRGAVCVAQKPMPSLTSACFSDHMHAARRSATVWRRVSTPVPWHHPSVSPFNWITNDCHTSFPFL